MCLLLQDHSDDSDDDLSDEVVCVCVCICMCVYVECVCMCVSERVDMCRDLNVLSVYFTSLYFSYQASDAGPFSSLQELKGHPGTHTHTHKHTHIY